MTSSVNHCSDQMLHGALKRVNSITIYHDDLESVQPGAFMRDTIIDVFSSLLATDDTKVVLGAIFFHLMTDGGWDSVHAMFGIQAPLGLQTKLIIIPVHTSNPEHWSLLVQRASLQMEGSFELFYIGALNSFEQFQILNRQILLVVVIRICHSFFNIQEIVFPATQTLPKRASVSFGQGLDGIP